MYMKSKEISKARSAYLRREGFRFVPGEVR